VGVAYTGSRVIESETVAKNPADRRNSFTLAEAKLASSAGDSWRETTGADRDRTRCCG
jgi:hypothetical protein